MKKKHNRAWRRNRTQREKRRAWRLADALRASNGGDTVNSIIMNGTFAEARAASDRLMAAMGKMTGVVVNPGWSATVVKG